MPTGGEEAMGAGQSVWHPMNTSENYSCRPTRYPSRYPWNRPRLATFTRARSSR